MEAAGQSRSLGAEVADDGRFVDPIVALEAWRKSAMEQQGLAEGQKPKLAMVATSGDPG